MEREKKSAVWKFFTITNATRSTATCKTCAVQVSRGGRVTKRFNTTNLIRHLEKCHAGEHAEFIELSKRHGGGVKQLTVKEEKEVKGRDPEAAYGDSDDDQRDDVLPSTQTAKPTEDHQGNNGIQKQGQPQTSSGPSTSTAALPLPGQPSQSVRDSMLQNASMSLQEQHATNILLETVSRSLELLSESVQQLAETQQEFVRESLQLQRETVQVLRDFTGGAIALMHDKLNGRPAL